MADFFILDIPVRPGIWLLLHHTIRPEIHRRYHFVLVQ